MLGVAVLGALALVASWVRPTVDPGGSIASGDARVGSTYAFDGVVCLGSGQLGATVRSVEVEQADGGSLEGTRVPAGEQDCVTRLVVVPDGQGVLRPGEVRVTYGYGPGGVLRRTASLRPDVALEVTGTGPDPRLDSP